MTAPTPIEVGVRGLCPRCGERTLFRAVAGFTPRCSACGLDFAGFNVGDGPAAFLTLIVGALIVGAAIAVELIFHPPFWVHLVVWIPLTALLVTGALRVAKGMLLALEYRNAAREGRLSDRLP